jgi:hypothetical protein
VFWRSKAIKDMLLDLKTISVRHTDNCRNTKDSHGYIFQLNEDTRGFKRVHGYITLQDGAKIADFNPTRFHHRLQLNSMIVHIVLHMLPLIVMKSYGLGDAVGDRSKASMCILSACQRTCLHLA